MSTFHCCTNENISHKSRTTSHEDEGRSSVDGPGGGLENRSRTAVTNGLVDAPVPARRKSLDKRTTQSSSM